ncbi:MAG: exonuclease SbcCD subunit D [Deltaproteobacteria bacterium]|nr:exonuclease SbcCD subunit D [Deltaproteobacteria bacterium]
MRILHTSDWHLGRTLHGISLHEDQEDALKQVVCELENEYDAVLIAGDIYDRAVPPKEAVKLLEWFFLTLEKLKVKTVIIPGNHDSATRLGFASGLLERSGVHLRCDYARLGEPVALKSKQGQQVDVFALPFVDAPYMSEALGDDSISNHAGATEAAVRLMREARREEVPAILMAHAFVGENLKTSESERIFIGGAHVVGADVFEGFDYVSLGHLHRPQKVGVDHIRYSGSLLPYSFSEAGHKKQMLRLEFDGPGAPHVQPVAIEPLHRVAVIEDDFESVLKESRYDELEQCYLSVRLNDDKYLINTFRRLKARFPNLLELRQIHLEATEDRNGSSAAGGAETPLEIVELFLDYFGWESGSKEREASVGIIEGIMRELDARDREALS